MSTKPSKTAGKKTAPKNTEPKSTEGGAPPEGGSNENGGEGAANPAGDQPPADKPEKKASKSKTPEGLVQLVRSEIDELTGGPRVGPLTADVPDEQVPEWLAANVGWRRAPTK